MIHGIGIDLARASRLKAAAERIPKLLDRLFTEGERAYCQAKRDPWPHFAARFAAKEAFVKAWGGPVAPKEMEIINNEKGRPALQLHGKILRLMKEDKIKHTHVSLSHEGDYAIAQVVLEG